MKLELGVPAWHQQAKCLDYPAEWFQSESRELVRQATTVCLHCPVRLQCAREADERGETWGVWGGKVRHKVRHGTSV